MSKTRRQAQSIYTIDNVFGIIRDQLPRRRKLGEEHHLLDLFHRCAKDVPAYRAFLAEQGIDPKSIRREEDIARIPPISKNTYVRKYSYADLFPKGLLTLPHILTATSGSTGEPAYFARTQTLNEQSAIIHEQFFLRTSLDPTKPTLVVVCFGMGIWIGGLITTEAFESMQRSGYPLAIITPGINTKEILRILKNVAPQYPQLILAGYPPFLKDVLDAAHAQGLSLNSQRVALITAAEAYTETFRDYLATKAGIRSILTDIMNIYGTADAGTNAFETPLSVLIRRIASSDVALFREIFGDIEKTPTLAQFIPAFTHFEEKGGELLLSSDSAMPLFRYAIGDHGGVRSFDEIKRMFGMRGRDLEKEMRTAKVSGETAHLPFVFVYERADLSTTLYGLQIFPQVIRETLLRETFLPFTTGRIALATTTDAAHNQYLDIHIEMQQGKEPHEGLVLALQTAIAADLKEKNAEYRELCAHLGERALPRLIFEPFGNPRYFPRDTKQKWVIRS